MSIGSIPNLFGCFRNGWQKGETVGVYQLSCNREDALKIWEQWRQSAPQGAEATDRAEEVAPLDLQVVPAADDHRVICSFRSPITGDDRIATMAIIAVPLVVFLALSFKLMDVFYFAAHSRISLLLVPICVIVFTSSLFILIFTLFQPLFHDEDLQEQESSFVEFAQQSHIEVQQLTQTRHPLLFPGDISVLFAGFFLLLSFVFRLWTGSWGWFARFSPAIALMILLLLEGVIRDYANTMYQVTYDAYRFWRIKSAEVLGSIRLFLIPLALYMIISIFMSIDLFIYNANTRYEQTGNQGLSQQELVATYLRLFFDDPRLSTLGAMGAQDHDFVGVYRQAVEGIPANARLVVLIGESLLIATLLFLAYVTFLLLDAQRELWLTRWRDHPPHRVPLEALTAPRLMSTSISMLVWVYWLFAMIVNVAGLGVVILVISWVLGLGVGPFANEWLTPLLWYEAALKSPWGALGSWLARGTALLVCSPAILWLLLWVRSLLSPFWLLIRLSFPRRRHYRATARLQFLCARLGISTPILVLEDASPNWASATIVLPSPRFSVIHVSSALIEELSETELDLVLAHELAHVTQHRWKLWLLPLLSRLCLIGPGYLALLLDYREMEFEADAFAIRVTGQPTVFAEMLQKQALTDFLIRLRLPDSVSRSQEEQSNMVRLISGIYHFYFGAPLWGMIHPTAQERGLQARSTVKSGSAQPWSSQL